MFVLPVDDLYLKPKISLDLLRLLRTISIPRLFFLVMGDIKTVEALFIEKSLADWTAVAGKELFPVESTRFEEALPRARELEARYLRKLLPPGQRAEIEPMDWFEALDLEIRYRAHSEMLKNILNEVQIITTNDKDASNKEKDSLLSFLVSPPLNDHELMVSLGTQEGIKNNRHDENHAKICKKKSRRT